MSNPISNKDWTMTSSYDPWALGLVPHARDCEMHKLISPCGYVKVQDSFIEDLQKADEMYLSQGYRRTLKYDGVRLRFVMLDKLILAVFPKSGILVRDTLNESHQSYSKMANLLQEYNFVDAEVYNIEIQGHSIASSILNRHKPFQYLYIQPILSPLGINLAPTCEILERDKFVEGYIYSKDNTNIKVKIYEYKDVIVSGFRQTTTGLISAIIVYNDTTTTAKIINSRSTTLNALVSKYNGRVRIRCRENQRGDIEEVFMLLD